MGRAELIHERILTTLRRPGTVKAWQALAGPVVMCGRGYLRLPFNRQPYLPLEPSRSAEENERVVAVSRAWRVRRGAQCFPK
jgi:hypothetical protein